MGRITIAKEKNSKGDISYVVNENGNRRAAFRTKTRAKAFAMSMFGKRIQGR